MSNEDVVREKLSLRHGEGITLEYRKDGLFVLIKTLDASSSKTLISLTQEELSEFIGKLVTVEGNLTPSKIL